MTEYCAAIDFGTNTARVLIARRTADGIEPVRVEREIVRLGGGFTDRDGLSDAACERGLACLRRFALIIAEYGAVRVRAVATSAVRDAVNGRKFVERVCADTGITLEVIDGNEEARLTLAGVCSALDTHHDRLVVLDVGGGSTECTVTLAGVPVFIKSMPIGVVRLTEGFSAVAAMQERVATVLDTLEADMAAVGITLTGDFELVGTAGTATTVAAIMLEMDEYDYRLVNNYSACRDDVHSLFERLLPLAPGERLLIRGLEKGREDLIIAGLIITLAFMDRFDLRKLKVSDFGLLEGLALSLCHSDSGCKV